MINLCLEYPDASRQFHNYSFSADAVPRVGETVKVDQDYFRVLQIVHDLTAGRIVLCVEG